MMLNRLSLWQPLAGRLLVFLLLGIGLSGGCEESSGAVAHLAGQVTLDDQPLPANAIASVTFRPLDVTEGRPVTAEIIESRYDCASVPRGKVLAQLSISIPTGRTVFSERTQREAPILEDVVLTQDQIGGIEIEVTGDADYDFELQRSVK